MIGAPPLWAYGSAAGALSLDQGLRPRNIQCMVVTPQQHTPKETTMYATTTDQQILAAIAERSAIVQAAPGYSMSIQVRIAENEMMSLIREAVARGIMG